MQGNIIYSGTLSGNCKAGLIKKEDLQTFTFRPKAVDTTISEDRSKAIVNQPGSYLRSIGVIEHISIYEDSG